MTTPAPEPAPEPDIRLTFRSLPDLDANGHPVPVGVRLRKLLKYARYQRLDCRDVEYLDRDTGEPRKGSTQ